MLGGKTALARTDVALSDNWIVNSMLVASVVRGTPRSPWQANMPLGEAVSVVLGEPYWSVTVMVVV